MRSRCARRQSQQSTGRKIAMTRSKHQTSPIDPGVRIATGTDPTVPSSLGGGADRRRRGTRQPGESGAGSGKGD